MGRIREAAVLLPRHRAGMKGGLDGDSRDFFMEAFQSVRRKLGRASFHTLRAHGLRPTTRPPLAPPRPYEAEEVPDRKVRFGG